jgi:hypothetical protein
MVEPAESRKCDDFAGARRLDRASDRCVALERHMRSILVVISRVLADETEKMPFPENDQVVDQLPAQRADPPLRMPVLPRRALRDLDLLDAEVIDARIERNTEDGIAVSD